MELNPPTSLTFCSKVGKEIGEFSCNTRNGQGVIIFTDGSKYEGMIVDGKMDGQGKMIYSNGMSYVGQWVMGERNGYGELTWPSGEKFCGPFMNNELFGEGTYY